MAKLLQYNAQVAPETSQTPKAPTSWGQYAGGSAAIGEGISRLAPAAAHVANIAQEFQDAQDAASWLNIQSDYEKWRGEKEIELANTPNIDIAQYDKDVAAFMDGLINKHAKNTPSAKRDIFRQHLQLSNQRHRAGVLRLAREKTVENTLTSAELAINSFAKNAITSGADFAEIENFVNDTIDSITIGIDTGNGVNANVLSPADATVRKERAIETYRAAFEKQRAEDTLNYAYKTGYGVIDNGGSIDDAKAAVKEFLPESQWDEVFRDFGYYVKDKEAKQELFVKSTREQIGVDIYRAIQSQDFASARELINKGKDGVLLEPTGENSMQGWQTKIEDAQKPTAKATDDEAWGIAADAVRKYKQGKLSAPDAYKVLVAQKNKIKETDYTSLRSSLDNLPEPQKRDISPEQQIIAKGYRDALEKVHYSTKTEEQREKMSKALIAFDLFSTKQHTKDEYQALMDNIFDNIQEPSMWVNDDGMSLLSEKGLTSFMEQAESGSENEVKIIEKGTGNAYFIPESQLKQALDSGEYEEAK